tara:strand:- start:668 stop:823 length:156 start_codon:yes stop_codon:yes gene_type:complete
MALSLFAEFGSFPFSQSTSNAVLEVMFHRPCTALFEDQTGTAYFSGYTHTL